VTVRNAKFNIQQFYVVITLALFCMNIRTNNNFYALHNINRLVFINEMEGVYCAVRTESLYIT